MQTIHQMTYPTSDRNHGASSPVSFRAASRQFESKIVYSSWSTSLRTAICTEASTPFPASKIIYVSTIVHVKNMIVKSISKIGFSCQTSIIMSLLRTAICTMVSMPFPLRVSYKQVSFMGGLFYIYVKYFIYII